jgi:hypothetical protein
VTNGRASAAKNNIFNFEMDIDRVSSR